MSLADALAEHAVERLKGPACTMWTILTDLDDDDAQTLRVALADRENITGRTIRAALNDTYGYRLARETVDRHRRGDCTCERRAAQG